ncbi:MAG: S41 family peptidase, partial [bacterium]
MSRPAKFLVICASLLIFSYVALGYVLGKTAEGKDGGDYRALTVFSEVLQRIQREYVEEPNIPLVTSGALHGLLESLDPQSSYLSPWEYAEFKKKSRDGVRGEIGVALSKRFGYIVVVSALPGSPAQKVGLRNGDFLEAISGFTTREMSIGQAQILLAGEPGTAVKVSLVSRRLGTGGQSQEVEITRAVLPSPQLAFEKIDGTGDREGDSHDIAYLRTPAFDSGKAQQVRQKLLQLERQGLR